MLLWFTTRSTTSCHSFVLRRGVGGGEFWMMSATSTYLVGIKIFVDRNE